MDEGRSLTAQAVADLVGGRLFGDGNVTLRSVGALDRAGPDTLSFLASVRFRPAFGSSQAGAVLITPEMANEPGGPATRIVVPKPQEALQALLPVLYPPVTVRPGIDSSVRIGRGAKLGEGLTLGPFVVIGAGAEIGDGSVLETGVFIGDGVRVGRNCRLGAHVVCHSGTVLGNGVELKACAVIGGTGFGYIPVADGHERIPHIGRCVLEDDVHVGSHTCIDRGSVDDTVIGQGTRIDNLVHIAHNVRIGRRCLVTATVAVAGSAHIGDDVIMAGGSGAADHVKIGNGARISARGVAISDVPAGETWGGMPARPHREWLRAQAALSRLSTIMKPLQKLLKQREDRAPNND